MLGYSWCGFDLEMLAFCFWVMLPAFVGLGVIYLFLRYIVFPVLKQYLKGDKGK